jgi:hypothetical protein
VTEERDIERERDEQAKEPEDKSSELRDLEAKDEGEDVRGGLTSRKAGKDQQDY